MFPASALANEHGHEAVQDSLHAASTHAVESAESLDPMGHILNSDFWEITHSLRFNISELIPIPTFHIGSLEVNLAPSLHVIMLWLAGLLLFLLLRKAASAEENMVPKGRLRNFFEAIILFVRDEVVYNTMGEKTGRRFLPYLLTVFFFILFINLLGLIPTMATATGNINVTATLAILTFMVTQGSGIKQNGFFQHWRNLVPPGVPWPLMIIMIPIEIMGMLTKPFSLTMRLFANMIAGHIIILSFFGLIFGMSLKLCALAALPFAGAVAISAFEIFVGFLQAFIFTFLSTIFINQAVHPEH
ncbi:MAG: F0F1 ATP synthase subunit A [bacterium]|nr:F0F1 ATP synthase subunit A [bacterium]